MESVKIVVLGKSVFLLTGAKPYKRKGNAVNALEVDVSRTKPRSL